MSEKNTSPYEQVNETIEVDVYKKKPFKKGEVRHYPVSMDNHIGTFGDEGDEFSGRIQGGAGGLTITIKNGNKYRITLQQMLSMVQKLEGAE
jgi:hypothetical protein